MEIRTTSVAGKVHLQFPSRLLSNPKGPDIASGVEDGAALIRQGEGITILIDGDSAATQIKFDDVLGSSIQLWDLNSRNMPIPNFYLTLGGRPARSLSGYANRLPLFEQLAKEVRGDPADTLALVNAMLSHGTVSWYCLFVKFYHHT